MAASPVTSRLTPQQQAAIDTRNVPIALSAGAGCGKTFVLTERFLSHLEPSRADGAAPARLSEIVAITFTERAAREMRDRIRRACQARLMSAANEDEAAYWLGIVRDLESARIMTIHAFCGALLRSHAVEAGLDPRFRVLDQVQSAAIFTEVVDDHLRQALAERREDIMDLVTAFGLDKLRTMVRSLLGNRDRIDFALWQNRTAAEVVAVWAEFHRTAVIPVLMEQLAASSNATQLLEILAEHESRNKVMQARCEFLKENLPRLTQMADPVQVVDEMREHCRVQGGGGKKDWPSEDIYNQVKDLLADFRKEIDKLSASLKFDAAAALPAAELGLQLMRLTEPISAEFARRKHQLGCLDFDDLLILARELLCPDHRAELRQQIARGIRALLIDEFQDTDPLQVDLVRALCADQLPSPNGGESGAAAGPPVSFTAPKLFFVGDFKQSIYRFRRADPRVFRQLRGETPETGRLPLTLNFRSQEQILTFVNTLFSGAFHPEYEPLESHRGQLHEEPCIEFLWASGEEVGEKRAELRAREADWIARRLRQLLDEERSIVYERAADGGAPCLRPVRPGDIAILFRALSDVALYEQALERHGIDYYLVGGHAFYAQQEIFDLLNLLRALAFPGDQISLAGVLRSPFFSLSDETLLWLARHPEGLAGGLYAPTPPPQLNAQQTDRAVFAARTLQTLQACKDRVPVAELIQQALSLTSYDAALLAEFLGERKLANLRKLIDLARTFDRSDVLTLSDFITQLSDFVANQPDEPLAATHPESMDVVRLMTIHQSKGLEFPVVVVPDLDRAMHGGGTPVAFDPLLGPLVRNPNDSAVVGLDFHSQLEKVEDHAERQRLLYVATTRAADYLILSSGVTEPGKGSSPWLKLIGERYDLLTGKFQSTDDRPSPCAEGARVRITLEMPEPAEKPRPKSRPQLDKVVEAAISAFDAAQFPDLNAVQPVPLDLAARREFSFSRLSGLLQPILLPSEEPLETTAAVPTGQPLGDPLGLGTLVHAVLEAIDFAQPPKKKELQAILARLAPEHLGSDDTQVAEAEDMLTRFLASPGAAALAAAPSVETEVEFLLAWPPGKKPATAPRYFRGFIDCLYRDAEGNWHLLDYKTNRVTAETAAAVAAKYEVQMYVYSLAAAQVLGTMPASASLYFLRPGLEYRFEFTADDHDRLAKQINEAMKRVAMPAALEPA